MANDAADGGAANGADCASTGQNCPANRTDSGANSSVLILSRHAGAGAEAKQQSGGECGGQGSLK
jgi:hypothetical protein